MKPQDSEILNLKFGHIEKKLEELTIITKRIDEKQTDFTTSVAILERITTEVNTILKDHDKRLGVVENKQTWITAKMSTVAAIAGVVVSAVLKFFE